MIDSKIQWCDDTVNVVEGCEPRRDAHRVAGAAIGIDLLAQPQVTAWREDGAPMETKPGHYAGLARLFPGRGLPQWTGQVRLRPDVLDAMFWRLLRARSPRRQFLCSMGDIFHAEVPDAFLDEVFARIAILEWQRGPFGAAWIHPILMLTKRPERAAEYTNAPDVAERVERAARAFIERERTAAFQITSRNGLAALISFTMPAWPLRSVALITSAGTQAGADARVPHLLRCKAAIRGVSCEPMTGPVDFSRWMPRAWGKRSDGVWGCNTCCNGDRCDDPSHVDRRRCPACNGSGAVQRIDLVIVGGESGDLNARREEMRPRPCELEWMESVVGQCQAAGVPCFVKQLGNVLAQRRRALRASQTDE